jgi:hypothetical protein
MSIKTEIPTAGEIHKADIIEHVCTLGNPITTELQQCEAEKMIMGAANLLRVKNVYGYRILDAEQREIVYAQIEKLVAALRNRDENSI